MDELTPLLVKLSGEVAALEAEVDQRQAEEDRQLQVHQLRLDQAEARIARAQSKLSDDGATLSLLEERRNQLLVRTSSWRGQLWRIGHSTAVLGLLSLALIPLPAVGTWLGASWMFGALALQAGLYFATFLVVPEKR